MNRTILFKLMDLSMKIIQDKINELFHGRTSVKTCLYKLSVCVLILTASFFLMSSTAVAVDLINPYFNFVGFFDYYADSDWLELTDFDITQVTYLDTTSSNSDAISGANVEWIFIGDLLYNDPSVDNLDFGGPARFEIKDTVTNEVFLTASLSNFQLSQECSTVPWLPDNCPPDPYYDPTLNIDYTLNSLWGLVVDPNYATSSSQYIQELGSVLNRDDGVVYNTDIKFEFTFHDGSEDNQFIGNGNGELSGKLVLMPEPVSSILFMAGSATLAIRRYFRKRNKEIS